MNDSPALAGKPRAARPKLAATLVLTRGQGESLEVLMGRRHADVKFMPHKYVFPGGRLERDDARFAPDFALAPELSARFGPRAQALALAAIRETFEETGLVVGHRASRRLARPPRQWMPFIETGHTPALDRLYGVARAVTPPVMPKRFDTYFFAVSVDDLLAAQSPLGAVGGELEEICWVSPARALKLDLVIITRMLLERMVTTGLLHADEKARPIPYYRHRGQKFRVDYL